MTLKSALQDLRETTLAAISGLFAKLSYLASLRTREHEYRHWGMAMLHGSESSERALKTAHSEVLSRVLRAPLNTLVDDLNRSSEESGVSTHEYADELRAKLPDLLPPQRDKASARHLNSVLIALSSLDESPEDATRST